MALSAVSEITVEWWWLSKLGRGEGNVGSLKGLKNLPRFVGHSGYVELVGHRLARLTAAVGHRGNLQSIHLLTGEGLGKLLDPVADS